MKNLILTLLLSFPLLFLNSCQEDDMETSQTIKTETVSKTVMLNVGNNNATARNTNVNVGEMEVTFYAEIDEETQLVTSWCVSENLLDAVEMSYEEFDSYLQVEMGDDYDFIFVEEQGEGDDGGDFSLKECKQDCRSRLIVDGVKQPGLGACRFDCWAEFVAQIAIAVIEAISK